jgi:hypothetical protein
LNIANLEEIETEKTNVFLNPFKIMIQKQIDFQNDPNIEGYRRNKN